MSDLTFTSTRDLMAAMTAAGEGEETLEGPQTFEDLVAAGAEIGPWGSPPEEDAATGAGVADDHGTQAGARASAANDDVIAGIEEPSAENIFAAYGFGTDLVFGDDELDYSLLAVGPDPRGGAPAGAVFRDDPIEASLAPGHPAEIDGVTTYITDDDQSIV